ncbi:MAG: hypothetical protein A3C85_01345 [Candidatus Doudnabacteria bacterium RIFCSPHIGHO2_02_FULL_48_21]|uniref:Uncharacterized protein n=1 Tax=Candidatus Doudnabacteria bacterium RIFCSPLOWO2_02_FULL_48_13 TaxID=1817845 RepID=A0A1F5Q943_9BACT|nr:MAG: hypothetical protein A3K05_04390 [Candidatus Doudnabacteria bacterium RIFCSPHIGHO2_01_48_18]OGE79602.1 MAG: hypothetical protein A2668_03400 [Candidatus Doudnabacteria bacterium RIFCSPHIGHO2_01_FULL_48_180]OGE91129.1 MAG: hypothetical protein A3F44_02285 [Candidatus Doudnabacteria bacterium RIFCSPHIGHO2_12_FULL_47_25]OGE93819.1 MAG: hypothetical protein A3C85_01345 [Candidatus Doudnabacteria bacterium RIFCSPHIGHO2_02_FULL_48_21]OGE98005.1 MAG: hypothetical protein A3A83_00930 [Candidatu
MYYDLEQKIEDYSEELFIDLGLATLTEETKADLFARVQNHLHQVIAEIVKQYLPAPDVTKINQALSEEDYRALDVVLKNYPQYKEQLETKIDEEFAKLKQTISEEQTNARLQSS